MTLLLSIERPLDIESTSQRVCVAWDLPTLTQKKIFRFLAVSIPETIALLLVADWGQNEPKLESNRNTTMKVKTNVKAGGMLNWGG